MGSSAAKLLLRVFLFTPTAHYRPRSLVQASRMYVLAPYGKLLRAMLASWHDWRVNGQTLVNQTYPSSRERAVQVAMEMDGLWLLRGTEKKGRGGHQWFQVTSHLEVSRVEWVGSKSEVWCTIHTEKTAWTLKRSLVTYWSALTDRK